MRGQGSLEYLLTVVVFLTILTSFTIPSMVNPSETTSEKIKSATRARSACDQIASAINNISKSGENATDTKSITLPENWSLEIEKDPPKLKIIIQINDETAKIKNDLDYGFSASKKLPHGKYKVIVKKSSKEKLVKSGDRIKIYLNPD